MKKALTIFCGLMLSGLGALAQSYCYQEVPCPPGHPGPICKELIECWEVEIINDLACDLDIYFDYSQFGSCGGTVFQDQVAAGQTKTVTAYERKFTGDGCNCLCPAWMRIGEFNGNPGYVPWAFENPSTQNPPPGGVAFMDCNGTPVYVTITYNPPNSATLHFHY
ncbi:hypothetical protein GYB22_03540 [bacterium]|nr:hypothetical protein [bacterium]